MHTNASTKLLGKNKKKKKKSGPGKQTQKKTYEVSNKASSSLEGHFLTLELGNTAPVLAGNVRASTAAATASTATSTSTSTATATAAAVVGTRRAVVQTNGTAVQVGTVEVVEGLASLINRRELHVTEALGAARLRVGRETDAHNVTAGTEHLMDGVLVGAEGQVANKQGLTLRAGLVTERASASLHTVPAVALVLVGGTTSSVVEVDLAAVNLSVLLGFVSLGRVKGVGVLDVTESRKRVSQSLPIGIFARQSTLTHESDQSHAQS